MWQTAESFPNLAVVNRGFGGSHTSDVNHYAARIVLKYAPRTIVFYAGDNDIAAGRTPQQVADDFKAFVAAVRKDVPNCRVLFLSIKPSPLRSAKADDQAKANALVREFCRSDPRLVFVDLVPLMLGPDGKPIPELYARDRLHLSPAGYEKWAPVVRQAIGK